MYIVHVYIFACLWDSLILSHSLSLTLSLFSPSRSLSLSALYHRRRLFGERSSSSRLSSRVPPTLCGRAEGSNRQSSPPLTAGLAMDRMSPVSASAGIFVETSPPLLLRSGRLQRKQVSRSWSDEQQVSRSLCDEPAILASIPACARLFSRGGGEAAESSSPPPLSRQSLVTAVCAGVLHTLCHFVFLCLLSWCLGLPVRLSVCLRTRGRAKRERKRQTNRQTDRQIGRGR